MFEHFIFSALRVSDGLYQDKPVYRPANGRDSPLLGTVTGFARQGEMGEIRSLFRLIAALRSQNPGQSGLKFNKGLGQCNGRQPDDPGTRPITEACQAELKGFATNLLGCLLQADPFFGIGWAIKGQGDVIILDRDLFAITAGEGLGHGPLNLPSQCRLRPEGKEKTAAFR